MKNIFLFKIHLFFVSIILLCLSGCSSNIPSRFYLLNTISQKPVIENSVNVSMGKAIAVGIGPIQTAGYLDRPGLVIMDSKQQLKFAEFDRWADSLKNQIPVILMENIASLLATNQVSLYPWRTSVPMDYQVTVEIIRLTANSNRDVELIARWNIFNYNGKKVLAMKLSTLLEPAKHSGYSGVVTAHNKVLATLSRQIALEIKKLATVHDQEM
ncbi:MAG: hypothetical protein B6I31_02270 [Desulfobacteraceae bacterium 4572_19]|nr:MAG: hypothetical protein B6I31_02270 [Desulfobacteraceae bacterium 4572_19]